MRSFLPAWALAAVPVLAGCGAGATGTGDAGIPTAFVVGIDHSYFPIAPGRTWTYEGEEEGLPRREEVRTLDGARVIAGVSCTALEEETWLDGVLDGVTTEWDAQDVDGNVWKFGEESWARVGEDLVLSEDSWLAKPRGPRPWMAFPADPVVGRRYAGFSPGGPDVHEIASVTDSAVVPAGAFADCLRIVENPDDPEDADIILYAPGVGRVSETTPTGHAELVSFGSP